MEGFTLTIIDSTGIQEYIFGSNKLKENIGASHLLVQVSRDWLYGALEQIAPGAHNFGSDAGIAKKPLEDDKNQYVEVIYSGGGNVVMLSQSETIAKDVVRALSRALLEHAPGLEITAAHQPLVAADTIGGPGGVYNNLLRALNRAKQQRRRSAPQLGLGVTLECRATGLPAVYYDDEENRPISSDIQAKLDAVKPANKRLEREFGDIYQQYAFGLDFDDFGRSRDDSSYIAVIHADGNSMGRRFERLVAQFGSAERNRACLNALRDLSQAVETSASEALEDALRQLNQSLKTDRQSVLDQRMRDFTADLKPKKGTSKTIFPVRPLVFGGDDLTLVCDGRLGLALAAVYLKSFHTHTTEHFADLFRGQEFAFLSDQTKAEARKPAHACAGVAIVKAHYPFARAYTLSEALCNNAKTALRDQQRGDSSAPDASAIDWHFAATGINAELGELRKRQYHVEVGDLTMRPISIAGAGIGQPWREWDVLRGLIETFVNDEEWRERHNKVVALREALRAKDVEGFLRNYKIEPLPKLDGGDEYLRTTGWSNTKAPLEKFYRCGYFDAIEALEFYLPIEPVQVKEAA